MTVKELIDRLHEFEPTLKVVIGAEGIFQGSPEPKDIFIEHHTKDYGDVVVIWGPRG